MQQLVSEGQPATSVGRETFSTRDTPIPTIFGLIRTQSRIGIGFDSRINYPIRSTYFSSRLSFQPKCMPWRNGENKPKAKNDDPLVTSFVMLTRT